MKKINKKLSGLALAVAASVVLSACQPVTPPVIVDESTSSTSTEATTSAPTESTPTTTAGIDSTTTEETTAEVTTELTTEATTEEEVEETTPRASVSMTDETTEPTTTAPVVEEDKGKFSNPYQVGETAYFDGYDTLFDPFRAEVVIQQIYRGPEALQMVKDASPINPDPEEGKEYLIAQVLVKVNASKNQESVGLSNYFFSLANGADARMYGDVTLLRNVTPALSPIQIGETSIGYVTFEVNQDDPSPYIVFLSRAHGGIWFETNNEAETTPSSLNEGDLDK